MLIVTALIALALSAAAALPGDWARRRASTTTEQLAQLGNATGVIATVALLIALDGARGFAGITILAVALIAGQILADTTASRLWGTTR